jgi:hypothetical protein
MVQSSNPFNSELPPAEFTHLGNENGTRSDPAIVGDNTSLKVAIEGESTQGMKPLNVGPDGNQGPEASGNPNILQPALRLRS